MKLDQTFFYHSKKKCENLKLMKNGKLLLNKVIQIFFIKLLEYSYIKTNIWIYNFIFSVYITCFIVKAQINYMLSLKEFKMREILCVSTFDIICSSNFNIKCVHHTMKIHKTPICVITIVYAMEAFHKFFQAFSNMWTLLYTLVNETSMACC